MATVKESRTLHFKAEQVLCEQHSERFSAEIDDLMKAILGLSFASELGEENSHQQRSNFDEALEKALAEIPEWRIIKAAEWPSLRKKAGDWNPRPDIVAESRRRPGERVIIEVEKANRQKVWDDIMKLCLFRQQGLCGLGVLICPSNYATRGADRSPYSYGTSPIPLSPAEGGRGEFRTPPVNLSSIGYTQLVLDSGDYVRWDRHACKKLKP